MTLKARKETYSAAVMGFLVASLLAGLLGLGEAVRLSGGGYEISFGESGRLAVAYALFGFLLALAIGLAFELGLKTASYGLPGFALSSRYRLVVPPVWTAVFFAAIYLNKRVLPGFLSPASLVANFFLAVGATVLVYLLVRWRPARLVLSTLLVLVLVGEVAGLWLASRNRGGEFSDDRPRQTQVMPADLPMLVLVVIDTLRADHLGSYGYGKSTSPQIDLLSERSLVFERAYSPSNWTRPAVASMMTSTRPSHHGVTDFQYAVPASLELVTETLKSVGYRTAIFSANPNLEPEDGYRRGTDAFVSFSHRGIVGRSFLFQQFLAKDLPSVERALRRVLGESRRVGYAPDRLTDRAFDWFDHNAGPRFAYLHYVGPHHPYLPPEDLLRRIGGGALDASVGTPPVSWAGAGAISARDREKMVAQYDAEILWHDQEIGRLVTRLDQIAAREEVVLVVTSDHGEGFGENGVWRHGGGLFDEVVRVPLIVWCSRSCGGPGRSQSLVSLLDVAPTLLDLAGTSSPASFEGRSLLDAVRSPETFHERAVISENPKTLESSIRTSDWSFSEKSADSKTLRWLWPTGGITVRVVDQTLGPDALDLVAQLEAQLREQTAISSPREEIELDRERQEELRALGYLN